MAVAGIVKMHRETTLGIDSGAITRKQMSNIKYK
jgi:hypothetical protein